MTTDIVIVGKGIAGVVMSYLLNQKGIRHIILERKSKIKPLELAETLPPSAMPLLHSIGLLPLFEEYSIRKTYGYHSLWGSERITDHNFYFQNPYKYGLKIDKSAITENLSNSTRSVEQYEHHLEVSNLENELLIKYTKSGENIVIHPQIVIDATGRNRAVLNQMNVENVSYDSNIAFTCYVPKKKHPKLKHDVYVEPFEDGWGLVSGNGEQQMVVSIFTHPQSPIFSKVGTYRNWAEILQHTQHLKYFLSEDMTTKVVGKLSNSSKPERVSGPNWMAIGDAALAFDPLSSHGVSNAIYTALSATEAVSTYLSLPNRNENSFKHYNDSLGEIFQAYLKSKEALYNTEKRWKNSAYWSHLTNDKYLASAL